MLMSLGPAMAMAGAVRAPAAAGPPVNGSGFALAGAVVVVGGREPSYVQYAASDLADYLAAVTGRPVPVRPSLDRSARRAVLVGREAAEHEIGAALQLASSDGEEYAIQRAQTGGIDCLIVAGATPKGTRLGVSALMRAVDGRGRTTHVGALPDGPVTPAFPLRGMHLNGWAFGYPYTFRCWTEADWRSYIDILACQGVNLLYLWPFMEIIPLPLSAEDRAYLEEVRRVVDYAQTHHGMEVWIMQAANRVARDNCGVADPRKRPYWRPSQEDLNPADPAQFRRIMESHEALYRIVDNVDAVCTIDSDPGGYRGSPLADYVKILRGCRELLDRWNVRGRKAKLVNWMWCGWGRPPGSPVFDPEYPHAVIPALKQALPEPWTLVAGIPEYLEPCRQEGVLQKTVYLPYGCIEGEPSYPGTNVCRGPVRAALGVLERYPGLGGVMGNCQCPLLQFPRASGFISAALAPASLGRSNRESEMAAARLLYPERQELIADCWEALGDTGPARPRRLAARLQAVVERGGLGRPGLIGRKLFPQPDIVARALAIELRLRAEWNALCEAATPRMTRETCARRVSALLDAYLTWDAAHGWHALWGPGAFRLGRLPEDPRYGRTITMVRRALGDGTARTAFWAEVQRDLADRHEPSLVASNAVEPLSSAIESALVIPANLAGRAEVTASVVADGARYPVRHAIDGDPSTLYWPGALVNDNEEWIELRWRKPQTIRRVDAYFLRHPSMWARKVKLQRQVGPGRWEDMDAAAPTDTGAHALATFTLAQPLRADRIRIVNLLDLFEVVVQ